MLVQKCDSVAYSLYSYLQKRTSHTIAGQAVLLLSRCLANTVSPKLLSTSGVSSTAPLILPLLLLPLPLLLLLDELPPAVHKH
jgi:hypothetical protein